jgi:hypothetical protein
MRRIELARFSVYEPGNVQPEAAAFINDPEGTWCLAVDALELVKYIRRLETTIDEFRGPSERGVSDAPSS